ncbi:hypothetical protein ACF1G0_30230 [Streptomyces sp. NPDC013953]|uniref:hypothetical protein n=1 Tax=Streptomyces sp. NPDC013953 TaxID=3364868 RepID=UPI0036FA1BE0
MASVLTLMMAMPLLVELWGFIELALEAPAPHDGPGIVVLMVPSLMCLGLPVALLVTLLGVLPTLALAGWAGRRSGREAWWWVPVASAVPVAVVAALPPSRTAPWWWWPAAVVTLSAVALVTRRAVPVRRPYRSVLFGGTLAMLAVGVTGIVVYGTGLVDEYHPPRTPMAELSGTWRDTRGGTLVLDPTGRATAEGLMPDTFRGDNRPAGRCDGTGTWTYDTGSGPWFQRVDVTLGDCWSGGWTVGGTPERLKLNHEYGDPDSPDWYVLTR